MWQAKKWISSSTYVNGKIFNVSRITHHKCVNTRKFQNTAVVYCYLLLDGSQCKLKLTSFPEYVLIINWISDDLSVISSIIVAPLWELWSQLRNYDSSNQKPLGRYISFHSILFHDSHYIKAPCKLIATTKNLRNEHLRMIVWGFFSKSWNIITIDPPTLSCRNGSDQ